MISLLQELQSLTIMKGQFKHPFELVRHAKKHGILPPKINPHKVELKPGEYRVPLKEKVKTKGINPMTGREKNLKNIKFLTTNIPPKDRTLKNLPRYADKKSKVRFQDWLELKNTSRSKHSIGQAANGDWLGWSHRAVAAFRIGQEIKGDMIGNKYQYDTEKIDKETKGMTDEQRDAWIKSQVNYKPYKIQTDQEAFEHAERFAKDVS